MFIEPSGIATYVEGRIIVASDNPEHYIQVFSTTGFLFPTQYAL